MTVSTETGQSAAERLATLSPDERREQLNLSDAEAGALLFDWSFWARPKQLPPAGDWAIWMIRTGRGFGKTRTGAEWVRSQVESGDRSRVALIAPTAADARDIMVEGESGIMACAPPWNRPRYEPSKRRVTWANGAIATLYSADEPDRLNGPQHDAAWSDELGVWRHAREAWDMLQFGLRLGDRPQQVITTTPKPSPVIRELSERPDVTLTTGHTYENLHNLAPSFREAIVGRYEGTRLGRQELAGELLEDVPGALWNRQMIDSLRVAVPPESLTRVVVGVDPAVTSGEDSDMTGIVTVGRGEDGHAYILRDSTLRATPETWRHRVVTDYTELKADRIIGEVNNGGDLVEANLRTVDRSVSYKAVHASRGKRIRAEPVAALYEQGRVHHAGIFDELEDQMCNFTADARYSDSDSPDRVDALVWALTELMLENSGAPSIRWL